MPAAAPAAALPPLRVLLAAPRGFCAGVERAAAAVEAALARHGAPVFVRHEIVHNRRVVEGLAARGAVFVDSLAEVAPGRPVVTSAHGIPRRVREEAARRGLLHIDAACPLVEKVHREVRRHAAAGRQVVLIGHRWHPEVEGTLGQAPPGEVLLVETEADCAALAPRDPARLAWATQTTLSVSDAARMVRALRRRFPAIEGPRRSDICYATTNRQAAVAAIAPECDALLVIGSGDSSNSARLVETARAAGCPEAARIEDAGALPRPIPARWRVLGLSAGASAPESLVEETLAALGAARALSVEEREAAREEVRFARARDPSGPAPS